MQGHRLRGKRGRDDNNVLRAEMGVVSGGENWAQDYSLCSDTCSC
jgi:hypothetical protein